MDCLYFIVTLALCITLASTRIIQSPDGDIIDCVDMKYQSAFDHPLLHNHKIQVAPKKLPKILQKMEETRVWQVWNQNGTICPDHTVPVRRNTAGTKHVRKSHLPGRQGVPYPTEKNHEYAVAYPATGMDTYGAQGTMSVWDPVVEAGTGEFSLSQIWIISGQYADSDINTIETGWEVFPDHYHDNQPRLFVSWTRDMYHKTGCLNLECPGFVQVPSAFALGAAFAPVSSYGGNQFEVTMLIWKDSGDNGNWWLAIGQSLVGYWPAELFTHLSYGPAKVVQWGGEVVNSQRFGHHTTTQMGSGHFGVESYGKASLFRDLKIIDYDYRLKPVQDLTLQSYKAKCYDAIKVNNAAWGTHFYFGGPCFSDLCV